MARKSGMSSKNTRAKAKRKSEIVVPRWFVLTALGSGVAYVAYQKATAYYGSELVHIALAAVAVAALCILVFRLTRRAGPIATGPDVSRAAQIRIAGEIMHNRREVGAARLRAISTIDRLQALDNTGSLN